MSLNSLIMEANPLSRTSDQLGSDIVAYDPMECSATLMPAYAETLAAETLPEQKTGLARTSTSGNWRDNTGPKCGLLVWLVDRAARHWAGAGALGLYLADTRAAGPVGFGEQIFYPSIAAVGPGNPRLVWPLFGILPTTRALRAVLRRTTTVCVTMCAAGWVAFQIFSEPLAEVFLVDRENAGLLRLASTCLLAVVAFNFLVEVLNALRFVRLNALIQFGQSLLFAVLCVAGLAWWRADAVAVIVAYAMACGGMLLVGGISLARHLRTLPRDCIVLPQRELWVKLLPFAAWVWVANLLTNLFDSSGRWMLLSWTPEATKLLRDSLAGNYHVAQLIPALMVTVASMLGGTLLPYLARDWKAGDARGFGHDESGDQTACSRAAGRFDDRLDVQAATVSSRLPRQVS